MHVGTSQWNIPVSRNSNTLSSHRFKLLVSSMLKGYVLQIHFTGKGEVVSSRNYTAILVNCNSHIHFCEWQEIWIPSSEMLAIMVYGKNFICDVHLIWLSSVQLREWETITVEDSWLKPQRWRLNRVIPCQINIKMCDHHGFRRNLILT